ncbi:MAG: hypothetical protein CMQ41_03995 [Gammaproteobacteria bacterium]|nr:hypothetical protein [Gammaproteobacteria bacterium]
MLVNAFLPILAIIFVGFCLSRFSVFSRSMWEDIEKLTYYLFFPALLVLRLSVSNLDWEVLYDTALVIILALITITVLFVIFHKFTSRDLASLSSVYQGTIRFNTYIALALFEALYGDRGIAQAAIVIAVFIPLVNVLSVASLTLQSEKGLRRIFVVFQGVITNPLVVACAIGLGLAFTGLAISDLIRDSLEILSQPALPLGLLVVGAGIKLIRIGEQTWQLCLAVLNKQLIFPSIVLAACLLCRVDGLVGITILILSCLPSPPSAYILARHLGGNVSLMANIITVQTLIAFFMVPVWVELAGRFL